MNADNAVPPKLTPKNPQEQKRQKEQEVESLDANSEKKIKSEINQRTT